MPGGPLRDVCIDYRLVVAKKSLFIIRLLSAFWCQPLKWSDIRIEFEGPRRVQLQKLSISHSVLVERDPQRLYRAGRDRTNLF